MSSRVGEQFRDRLSSGGEGPLMVVVPAGSFLMGSPSDEELRDDDEGPLHLVRIAAPFAIGVYPVTFADWDACVSAGGGEGHRPDDAGWGRGQRPVINVSWHDAQSYVEWLSRETGEAYRLPTEAEWEYAARAGTTTPYHTGAAISMNQAQVSEPGFLNRTAEVGTFAANAWGLHDVHGNVREWVEDCWHKNYKGAPEDGSAWLGWDYEARVCRGGHWSNHEGDVRSASRAWGWHRERSDCVGFRIAKAMTISSEKAGMRPHGVSQTGALASRKTRSARRADVAAPPTPSLIKHLRYKTSPPYQVGDRFRDRLSSGGEGPLMVVVPAGSFLMGAPSHEQDEYDEHAAVGGAREGPVHRVWFRAPFAIAIHPTTFAEWEVCKKAGGLEDLPVKDGECGPGEDPGWGHEECAERPVINASWHDAQSYLAWLSYETGATYRLPSEAEWEYAARAGTTTSYSTGAVISNKEAHYDYGNAFLRPIDVGTFEPNPWGLHDVHGNVEEWVEDRWHEGYAGAPKDGSAWVDFDLTGAIEWLREPYLWNDSRVTRGGSFDDWPVEVRSAWRFPRAPEERERTVGFRVARTLTP